ncbi:MAG TPA: transglycosylase domain-containing protein, partial [Candidatus Binataceae bacterium]|nr:transglycosylase domain-containing protein [Candidatus Binataceae bacterium]
MSSGGSGGRGKGPASARAPRRTPPRGASREWRIRGWRVRRLATAVLLVVCFGVGFYVAEVYGEITALIDQRRAAITSAIYSAPAVLRVGDDIKLSGFFDRLDHLAYSRTLDPTRPGEYASAAQGIAIFIREFHIGTVEHHAQLVRIQLSGTLVRRIADSFGVEKDAAVLEPEVIGRLLPGASVERAEVRLQDVPPFVVKGLLATEDRWFYWHPGIDPIRIVEAAITDLRSHRLGQGASTITQQLARTFLDRHERSFSRKGRELAVAMVLELKLSKNEILERYINDVPMGAYDGTPIEGLPQAARYFFNKDLREVTPAEAAALIGMIRAPTAYDPRRHPDQSRARRNTVLVLMRDAGAIDQAEFAQAAASTVQVASSPGLRRAPYFTDYVTSFVQKIPGLHGKLDALK